MQMSSWSLYDSPPPPPPLPLPLPSSTGVDSRLQLLACGLYPRLMARTSFGPAKPQHCPHYCWQGMHGLPKCGSALVTMLLLVCLAGPSTSGRPASSTPWGWEPSRAPPRAVSFQQYLSSLAWIRGISQIPDVAELRQVFLFIYFMLSLDTWHLSDTPMQLSSIDVHMLWYVLQFLVSPWAVYLPPGSVVIRAAVLSQSLGSVPASRFLATSTLVAPLHAVHRPFCYQATSHCKGQPFAAYGLSWCSANALTAWVSVKWLSPLDTPATGLLQCLPMCTTGPYPSLSLTLPGSFRQCSGVTPPSLGQEQLTDARSVPPPLPSARSSLQMHAPFLPPQVAGHQSLDC